MTIFFTKNIHLPLMVCSVTAGLFLAGSAQAQQGEGTLTGTVTDAATKAPVVDVVVTATSPALQGEQIVVTDATGFYRVPNLPPGVYTLRFDKEVYKPLARDGITLRAETTIRLNIQLLPEALQAEEVVVVARSPTVDVGSSSTGANLNAEFTRRVPVSAPGGKGTAARSFESVAEAAPGASGDDFGTSINGATSAENSYIIDGLTTNNPGFGIAGTPLSTEFVGEVNVVSGGYMPEYGRSTGGVLSVVTKSGSNDWRGGFWSFLSPGALEGPRAAVPRDAQSVLWGQKLKYEADSGFDIGGPIIKDKLWFYFGFDYSTSVYDIRRSLHKTILDSNGMPVTDGIFTLTEEIPGTATNYQANLNTYQAIGKLTFALNSSNRLTFTGMYLPSSGGGGATFQKRYPGDKFDPTKFNADSFSGGRFSIDPRTGSPEVGTDSPGGTIESLGHQRSSTPIDVSLRWTTESPKKNLTVETLVGWHRQTEELLPVDGSAIGSGQGLSSLPSIIWRQDTPFPHDLSQLDRMSRINLTVACEAVQEGKKAPRCPATEYWSNGPGQLDKQTYDRYQASTTATYLFPWLGHHIAKAGFNIEYTSYLHIKSFSGGVQYQEEADGSLISDLWQFGVLKGPDQPVFLDPRRPKTSSVIAGGFVQDSWSLLDKVTLNLGVRYDTQALYGADGQLGLVLPNQWSPRLGVIYDPTQAGRAKIFFNYARYYENVPLDLADVAISGEPHVLAQHDTDCDPPKTMFNAKGCLAHNAVQNGATSPNQQYVSFGAGASPVDPNIEPQSSDEYVVGGDYEVFPDARLAVTYTNRRMNKVVEDMSRDGLQTFFLGNPGYGIASDFPKARRDYDAFTIQLVKNFRDRWLANASYTVSWLRGNIGGLFDNGALIPNHTANFDSKEFMINRDGYLPQDHRHAFKLFGARDWRLPFPRHLISTGVALRATSGGPTSVLGSDINYGTGESYLEQRGTGPRLPWEYSADLQIGYRLQTGKESQLVVTVDVFNFLNIQGATELDQVYTNSNTTPKQGGKRGEAVIADTESAGKPVEQSNPNFGHTTGYQSPRVFRFGLRWTF